MKPKFGNLERSIRPSFLLSKSHFFHTSTECRNSYYTHLLSLLSKTFNCPYRTDLNLKHIVFSNMKISDKNNSTTIRSIKLSITGMKIKEMKAEMTRYLIFEPHLVSISEKIIARRFGLLRSCNKFEDINPN